MFAKPEVMTLAAAMSAHAANRQAVVAANLANADTPGYVARDMSAFADLVRDAAGPMRATRGGHAGFAEPAVVAAPTAFAESHRSPNGNGVSVEREMMRAAEVKREHDLALSIYRSSLDLLRASIGRR